MELMDSFRILRKRWILTTLLLLLTVAGTAAIGSKSKTYTAASTVVLLASDSASKPNGSNPYLSFSSSLQLTADVVRREVIDPRTASSLAAEGYTASYLVADAVDTPGPVLLVTVTGHNKALVEHTLYGVTAEIKTKLGELQASISPVNKIGIATLSFSPNATLALSKMARPVVAVLGVGLVLTFAIPLIVDGQVRRRRRTRTPASSTAVGASDEGLINRRRAAPDYVRGGPRPSAGRVQPQVVHRTGYARPRAGDPHS